MRTLVTGATGFVGSFLVEELLEEGHDVICQVRKISNLRWIRDLPVEFVTMDITEPALEPGRLSDVEMVFHVAGLITARSRSAFRNVNANGVENMIALLHRAGAPLERFVLVSSLAAAGPAEDREPLDETDSCRPVSHYGQSKREGELRLLKERNGFPYTIVRPPIIMGPRDPMLRDLVNMVSGKVVPIMGRYKQYSFIFVRDLVRGLRKLGTSPEGENCTYFLSHAEPVQWKMLIRSIGRELGIEPICVSVPEGIVDVLVFLSEELGAPGIPDSLTYDKAREIKQRSWLCSPARAREEVGFEAEYDLERSIEETVSWYRKKGWIPRDIGE